MQRFPTDKMASQAAAIRAAASLGPVALTEGGQDRFVVLDAAEFARLKRRDKAVIAIEDMPEEFVRALEQPYHNPQMAALDHLMDD